MTFIYADISPVILRRERKRASKDDGPRFLPAHPSRRARCARLRARPRSQSQVSKREKGIWQRRYWEHFIRDDADLERHVDYIHFNPVKHRLVTRVVDWPHSSFHRFVKRGLLASDWGGDLMDITGSFGE